MPGPGWLTFSAFSFLAYPLLPGSFSFSLRLVAPVLHPSPIQSSSPPAMWFIFAPGQEPGWEAVQDSGWTCNVVC